MFIANDCIATAIRWSPLPFAFQFTVPVELETQPGPISATDEDLGNAIIYGIEPGECELGQLDEYIRSFLG